MVMQIRQKGYSFSEEIDTMLGLTNKTVSLQLNSTDAGYTGFLKSLDIRLQLR